MTKKGSPNLYEILKGSRSESLRVPEPEPRTVPAAEPPPLIEMPPEEDEEVGPQECVPVAAAEIPPPPPPLRPAPAPGVTRPRAVAVPAPNLGERTVALTYNTAGFLGLVVLGLFFLAYSLGVRTGRGEPPTSTGGGEVAASVEEARRAGGEVDSPARERTLSIRLMEWAADTDQDRVSNLVNAQKLKEALDKRGMKEAWQQVEERGRAKRVVLYYGRYRPDQESEIRAAMKQLAQFVLRGKNGKTSSPFERCAPVEIREESKMAAEK